MESPGLVFPNTPLDVMANGADKLLPLFDDEISEDFMSWCESRVDIHWPKIRDEIPENGPKMREKQEIGMITLWMIIAICVLQH